MLRRGAFFSVTLEPAMTIKVLGISTSPRQRGNSDLLLRQALAGAETAGAETEYLSLQGLSITPCQACNACFKTGVCRIDDDFQPIFGKLLDLDRLVFATPVHFMAVCAQAKVLIDRCQCLWARKYVLRRPLFPEGSRDRRAMVIAVAGSRSTSTFDCIALTMRYYLDAVAVDYALNLFVNQVDERGAVMQHPSAMDEALRIGAELVSGELPADGPRTVELF
jgi:multimeric flavodoxin WrbA